MTVLRPVRAPFGPIPESWTRAVSSISDDDVAEDVSASLAELQRIRVQRPVIKERDHWQRLYWSLDGDRGYTHHLLMRARFPVTYRARWAISSALIHIVNWLRGVQ